MITAASPLSLEYAENIVETVREPLLVLDSNLHIISANAAFYSTFKVTAAETIGNFIYELGNRQWNIPALRVLLENILPQNTVFNDYEVDHLFQNIGRKIIMLNARQIFREDIGSHIILLAMEDITERRLKTIASSERLKELTCLYSIIDMCSEAGISRDKLFTEAVMLIPPTWQFPEVTEASIEIDGLFFQTAHFRETPWMLESSITVHDIVVGQVSVCYLQNRQTNDEWAFTIEEQHLLNAIASRLGRYIERDNIETKLRKLSAAIEQCPVSIVITDTNGAIEFVNPYFTTLTGYSSEEVIGQNPRILKSGLTPPETYQKLWSSISAGKQWEGTLCNVRKDGSLFYENVMISPLRDSSGAVTNYLGIKEDITEKKNVYEQLIHSQKIESIGELAGGLAHDLNNILSVINGYATLAQLGIDREHIGFGYLTEVNRASSRAATLTRSLLAYSRKQEMNQENQDLNPLVETVGSFIKRIIRENITFTLSLHGDPLSVYVDTVQIEQVLLNLATNARDAMPDGGSFSIATTAGSIDERFIATRGLGTVGRYAIITVTDSGCGMDEQTKRRAFDPFFTTKERNKGTGLGLSMIQGIIRQHGGFIDLQSEPGKGSVFQLYLPLVDYEESFAEEPVEQQSLQTEKNFGTIMVAEDDDDTREAMAAFLTRAGYTVITATDGQDAVEKFAAWTGKIDLVVSDVCMPRKSGKVASEEIRKMSRSVKFIFVSGHADEVIWRGEWFGPNFEIMAKPILPFELLQKIMTLLQPVGSVA